MPVDSPAGDQFWVSRSYAEIFHRNPALAAPVAEEQDELTELRKQRETNENEASGPRGVGRTSREFQDVSEVRSERGSMLSFGDADGGRAIEEDRDPERDGAPAAGPAETTEGDETDEEEFEELEREAPDADLDDLERELSFIAADAAEDAAGTPLPLPVEQPSSASIEADIPFDGDDETVDGEPEETSAEATVEQPSPAPAEEADSIAEADETEPMPAEDLFEEWEDEIERETEEGEAVYDVRVQDTIERDVGLRRLVEMLKEGVWTGAVEIGDGEEWVPLRQHEVFDRLKDYLVGQSRQILVDGEPSETGEAEADESDEAETDGSAEPPQPPEASERSSEEEVAQSDGESSEPEIAPESAPERRDDARYGWRVFAGGLLVGVTMLGVLIWSRVEPEKPDGTVSDGSAGEGAAASLASAPDGGPEEQPANEGDGGDSDDTRRRDQETGASDTAPAVAAARRSVEEALTPDRHATRFLAEKKYGAARRWAIRAMVDRGIGSELQEIFDASIKNDESLIAETVTIGRDESIGAIHALGGGWSVSFRLTRGGEPAYAFKPAQKHWKEGWRAEIAAYRLCRIIACHFVVPRNRPARISKQQFETLYSKIDNEDQEAYRRRFDDLIWKKEAGPDGKQRKYLYGTIKDWVPAFAKWPIEYDDVWQPWLDADSDPAVLGRPLTKTLAPLKDRGEEDFYKSILEESDGATTRSIARQLSTVLTFDFLISNWDRFSTAESYYGVNNQFRNGHFVSIDNGAAFPAHHFRVVARRLEAVTRFSRSTVASVRALRPEVVNPVLFPDASATEESRLDVFWRQRDRFLDKINGLVAEYGRERVLYFE